MNTFVHNTLSVAKTSRRLTKMFLAYQKGGLNNPIFIANTASKSKSN